MEKVSQVADLCVQSESLLAQAGLPSVQPGAWGVDLEECQLPAPLHPLLLPAFPGSPLSSSPPLSWDSRQSLGTNCRPLSQSPVLSPLDAGKAGVGAVTLSLLDPQMQPACLPACLQTP